ncbi:MAG: PAS domain-containing protein [Cytophagales bacterium]
MITGLIKISRAFVLKIAFAASIAVLLLTSLFSFERNQSMVADSRLVDHTSTVIRKINTILLLFKDYQISLAEFVISKDQKFLSTHVAARDNIYNHFQTLNFLVADNADQQKNIGKTGNLLAHYFAKVDALIKIKRKPQDLFNLLFDQKEAETALLSLNNMKEMELGLLKTRMQTFDDSSGNSPFIIILFSVLATCFVGISYFVIHQNIKNIRVKEQEILLAFDQAKANNEALNASNEGLVVAKNELSRNREILVNSNKELLTKQEEIWVRNQVLKENYLNISKYKEELEALKFRLLEAQQIANLGNWEWNIEGNQIYWSDQLMVIFDHNPIEKDSFTYETFLSLLHDEDKKLLNDAVQQIRIDFKPYTIEHKLQRKDGSIGWVLSKGKVVLSAAGKVVKMIGTTLDITDLKLAQTEEEKLVAVIENSSDFIGLGDNDGNILFMNPAGRKLLGIDKSALPSTINILKYISYKDQVFANEHIMPMVFETGKWSGEIHFINQQTKEAIPVCWNVFLVKDKTHQSIGIGHILQDMRTDKKIRYELQVMNEELSSVIEELRQAEEHLVMANRELETRIVERTKALFISEERFRTVSLATNDAIWDWDLDENTLWWNEGFTTMFGYQKEVIELGIDSLHSRIHPEDRDSIVNDRGQFLVSGKVQWTAEYRFLNAAGIYIYVMERGYAMYADSDKPYRMLGSLINISEKKELDNARLKLHELSELQRQKLYGLLMDIPAAVTIMKGRDLIYEMANQKYKELIGAEGNIIGTSRRGVVPAHTTDFVVELIDAVYNTGSLYYKAEFPTSVWRNGKMEKSYFNMVLNPIYDQQHQIEGVMMYAVEVTEQVISRMKVEESSEQIKVILEAIPQMTWINDSNGEVIYFNSKWYEFTGATFEQSKGLGWYQYLHADDVEQTSHEWNKALATGRLFQVENRWKKQSDNAYHWMLARAVCIKNIEGEIINWVCTLTDIDDQKTTANALDLKNQELMKINELLDTFVYTAAHDLRSPVINLKSLFELIKVTDDKATKDKYFSTIDIAVQRLDDTITGLVEVIDIQSEDNKIAKILDLQESLAQVLTDCITSLGAIGGHVEADFSQCPEVHYLKSYLNTIFTNLVGNCIKYRSENVALQVAISSYKSDCYVILQVKDNGIGIDLKANGSKIFKAFNRFSRNAEGKGLGLYLIKSMVERNGGKLEVESALNEGTTFRIFLKEYN